MHFMKVYNKSLAFNYIFLNFSICISRSFGEKKGEKKGGRERERT